MGIRTEIESQFDLEIVDDFLDGFEVMVDTLEPLIMDLEHSSHYVQDINELFRLFHNIKSATAYLHLNSINRLAALVEDILEDLRKKESLPSEEVLDWLLSVSDQFRLFQQDFEFDRELSKIPYKLLKIPDTY